MRMGLATSNVYVSDLPKILLERFWFLFFLLTPQNKTRLNGAMSNRILFASTGTSSGYWNQQ